MEKGRRASRVSKGRTELVPFGLCLAPPLLEIVILGELEKTRVSVPAETSKNGAALVTEGGESLGASR